MFEETTNQCHLISVTMNLIDELLVLEGVGLPHFAQFQFHLGLVVGPDLDDPIDVGGVAAGPDGGGPRVLDVHVVLPVAGAPEVAHSELQPATGGAVHLELLVSSIKVTRYTDMRVI